MHHTTGITLDSGPHIVQVYRPSLNGFTATVQTSSREHLIEVDPYSPDHTICVRLVRKDLM